MKKPRNYDTAETITAGKRIPAGGYVCKIINVKEQVSQSGKDMLVLAFDIAEGDYKDYYKEGYEKNTSEDKKWRGNFYMMVPEEDAELDSWQLRRFKTNISKFEDSNSGYHFDWEHPEKMTGLLIGMIFGEEEYIDGQGASKFSVKPKQLELVDTIRSGDFDIPAIKYLNGTAPTNNVNPAGTDFVSIPDGVGDSIPFNF